MSDRCCSGSCRYPEDAEHQTVVKADRRVGKTDVEAEEVDEKTVDARHSGDESVVVCFGPGPGGCADYGEKKGDEVVDRRGG